MAVHIMFSDLGLQFRTCLMCCGVLMTVSLQHSVTISQPLWQPILLYGLSRAVIHVRPAAAQMNRTLTA